MTEPELSRLFHLSFALVHDPRRYSYWLKTTGSAFFTPSSSLKDALDALMKEFAASKELRRADLARIGDALYASQSEGPKAAGRALLHALEQQAVS